MPLLVSHGADLEARDGDGLRPIHVAAKTGRHVALLALLASGADAWSVTPRKWNALHYSIAGGYLDAARLLAYWDSDSGILGRQTNSAGVAAMDLGRCGRGRGREARPSHIFDTRLKKPLLCYSLIYIERETAVEEDVSLPVLSRRRCCFWDQWCAARLQIYVVPPESTPR